MSGLPSAHPAVSVGTASALVASQFPEFAALPLGPMSYGWDNAMIPLGDELAVRMPRIEAAVGSLLKERALLHERGRRWTFPFPRIVADGEPGHGYPWPWSIVTWLEGDIAATAPLDSRGAAQLGRAIAQIHDAAPHDAPYNDEQSLPLAARGQGVASALEVLESRGGPNGERLAAHRARVVWDAALEAPAAFESVWSHADLHGYNVVTRRGELAGIIDWGDMAGCDPAVDLGFVHTLTDTEGVAAAFAEYAAARSMDDALVARARGVAVHVCAGLAVWPSQETSAMGWRGLASLGVTHPG